MWWRVPFPTLACFTHSHNLYISVIEGYSCCLSRPCILLDNKLTYGNEHRDSLFFFPPPPLYCKYLFLYGTIWDCSLVSCLYSFIRALVRVMAIQDPNRFPFAFQIQWISDHIFKQSTYLLPEVNFAQREICACPEVGKGKNILLFLSYTCIESCAMPYFIH